MAAQAAVACKSPRLPPSPSYPRFGLTLARRRLWFSQIQTWLIQCELPTFRQFPPITVLSALLASTLSVFRSRAVLQLEILALRHQLGVLQRSVKKPKLNRFDRFLWAWFCELGPKALGSVHCQTGNRHSLAPQRILIVLDLESPPRPTPYGPEIGSS